MLLLRSPPRLGGKKVGVFSTRSPHRPNPIGLTMVKLDSVSGRDLWISGIDLVGECSSRAAAAAIRGNGLHAAEWEVYIEP